MPAHGHGRTPETDRARLRDLLALGPTVRGEEDRGAGDGAGAGAGAGRPSAATVVGPDGAPVGPTAGADGPLLVGIRRVPTDGASAAAQADIPAYLLRPAPERDLGAGVVLIAGHGRGIDDLVSTDPADEYHDGLAHTLAGIGFTVLAPEAISFGRRRFPRPEGAEPYEERENSCGIDAARDLLRGQPLMGARVADAGLAAAALRTLDGVDPARIAVVGGSGGGAVSLLLAAMDDSIAGVLSATYFSSFAASLCSIRHCPCNIIPGILDGSHDLEMADIGALVAPRPLIIEAGERDRIPDRRDPRRLRADRSAGPRPARGDGRGAPLRRRGVRAAARRGPRLSGGRRASGPTGWTPGRARRPPGGGGVSGLPNGISRLPNALSDGAGWRSPHRREL